MSNGGFGGVHQKLLDALARPAGGVRVILYLHGFRSSPQSFKARVMRARLAELGRLDEWQCPVLPVSPREAIALAEKIAAGSADAHVTVIGSSLGGFYATYLAEKHGWRAVLLNPAVVPQRDLSHYLGSSRSGMAAGASSWNRIIWMSCARSPCESVTRPQRYYLIAATGDEVLDYRTMLDHYPGVRTTLIQGGDHAISDFPKYLDQVLAFCASGRRSRSRRLRPENGRRGTFFHRERATQGNRTQSPSRPKVAPFRPPVRGADSHRFTPISADSHRFMLLLRRRSAFVAGRRQATRKRRRASALSYELRQVFRVAGPQSYEVLSERFLRGIG